ncbi:hypothetical protein VMCG_10161 [Cytospora schulzeri]|uniref:Myb-like domain-containing protein n=1 Tax=Cytospora schulzeri TaxID=448051 RepID=A0A423VCY7_9PEZI|nr:hypothetical protein VMCG_10161 [Valsa malicola]
MEQMNHVPRVVSTPDQSHPVSLQPLAVDSNHANGLPELNPRYLAPMPSSASDTATKTNPAGNVPPSTPNWFNTTNTPAGDGSIGQYGVYGGLPNSLYYDTFNLSGSAFDLGAVGGAMPNYFESPSSSTYPMNSSSPNTMFGSFSSSIGPPENMDMDLPEFMHNPASIPGGTASGLYPGVQRQEAFAIPPTPLFPSSTNPGIVQPQTVSPSMLRLNNTPSLPMATSSSESLSGSYSPFHMDTDSNSVQGTTNTIPETLILPSSDQQSRRRTGHRNTHRGSNSGSKWGRKALPDKAPTQQFILPNNGAKRRSEPDSTISPKPHSKKSKAKNKTSAEFQLRNHHAEFASPSGAQATSSTGIQAPSSSSTAAEAAADDPTSGRSAQDDFLVNSRLSGMKYSQIRKLGNFKEAESTLRGRFRTLMKPKEARVRNPQWQEIDDKLLKQAVPKLTKNNDNVPWKAVADYIFNHGGTYRFGYNTCHKRWNYLKETSDEQVKKDRINGKKDM